jgi:hypothetical protein
MIAVSNQLSEGQMKSSNSIFDVMPDFLRVSRSGVDSPPN